jgi:hypothetical protein
MNSFQSEAASSTGLSATKTAGASICSLQPVVVNNCTVLQSMVLTLKWTCFALLCRVECMAAYVRM